MRDLWAIWMREGEKTYTKSGNMRSPSKTQLVDMVIDAWNQISVDQIIRSFQVGGQGGDLVAHDILCMREGRSCHKGLTSLKILLSLPQQQRSLAVLGDI